MAEDTPIKKDPSATGISGQAILTLRDAKTGIIKQQVTSKNTILARGLDWIVSHIVTGKLPTSSLADGGTSDYHATISAAQAATPEKNPFKALSLLNLHSGSSALSSVDFQEGWAAPGQTRYMHYVQSGSGTTNNGIDVSVVHSVLGDTSSGNASAHDLSGESNRDLVLCSKTTYWDYSSKTYTQTSDIQTGSSIQSNASSADSNNFGSVYIVFKFSTSEANGTINSIMWSNANSSWATDGILLGARLNINPITKTSNDDLDITYKFTLA